MKVTLKVSIVEDDVQLRSTFKGLVDRTDGMSCVSASASAESAIEEIRIAAPDVVLMDINLPGMNGIECTRRVKAERPNAQIVMLTTFDTNHAIFESLAAGATGYVLKRAPANEVIEAIREVHGGGSPMSPAIARKVVQHFSGRRDDVPDASGRLSLLTDRERAVLNALAECQQYKEIAENLGISINTVRTYIKNIYEKLQVSTRHEAVRSLGQ